MASPSPDKEKKAFELNGLEVDPWRRTISGSAGEVTIEPKVMAVLLMLVHRPGEVITRQEFIDSIWAEEYGGDESLTRAISHLRKVFGNHHNNQAHIETIPKTGYRLIAEKQSPKTVTRPRIWFRLLLAGAVTLALLALSINSIVDWKRGNSFSPVMDNPASVVLAVLPFDSQSDVSEDVSLAHGLADEILSTLSQSSSIAVIGGSSSFRFVGDKKKDLATLSRQLNVSHVIDGLVHRSPEGLHVGIRLIDAGTGLVVWSDVVTRSESEIYTIPNVVAIAVQTALGTTPPEAVQRKAPPDSLAYGAYLQAKALSREAYDWNLTRAIKLLEAAVERDPNLSEAWAALAWARLDLAHVETSSESRVFNEAPFSYLLAARRDANSALAIDPTSIDALLAIAIINLVDRSDTLVESESRISSLLVRAPNHPNVNMRMGILQMSVGRWQEARRFMRIALDMDPFSALTSFYYGTTLVGGEHVVELHAFMGKVGASEFYRRSYPWLVEKLVAKDFNGARHFFTPLKDGNEFFTKGLGMKENIDADSPKANRLIQLIGQLVTAAEQADAAINLTIAEDMEQAANEGLIPFSWVCQLLAAAGLSEAALELARERIALGEIWYREILLMPAFKSGRRDTRIMELFEATGQLDYWLQTGNWPDFCAGPELPYDCENAAQQLR